MRTASTPNKLGHASTTKTSSYGGCRRGKESVVTRSPYFSNNTRRKNVVSPSTPPNVTQSRYFLRRPGSSVYGAIAQVGSLVDAQLCSLQLSSKRKRRLDHDSDYTVGAKATTASSSSSCEEERPLELVAALFDDCPVFRHHYRKQQQQQQQQQPQQDDDENNDNALRASESLFLESSVRHLCPHQCFFRAFAPYRQRVLLGGARDRGTSGPSRSSAKSSATVHPKRYKRTASSQQDQPQQRKSSSSHRQRAASSPRALDFDQQQQQQQQQDYKSESSFGNKKQRHAVFIANAAVLDNKRQQQQQSSLSMLHSANVASRRSHPAITPPAPTPSQPPYRSSYPHTTLAQSVHSPLGLLEELFTNDDDDDDDDNDDPWKLFLCTILLNKTQRAQGVDGVLYQFLETWPTPQHVVQLVEQQQEEEEEGSLLDDLANLLQPLGLYKRRAAGIIRFCADYVRLQQLANNTNNNIDMKNLTRSQVLGLFGIGVYAADAYRIFIQRDWGFVPTDTTLQAYVEYKMAVETLSH